MTISLHVFTQSIFSSTLQNNTVLLHCAALPYNHTIYELTMNSKQELFSFIFFF